MENTRERQPDMQSYRRQKQVKIRGVVSGRKTMKKNMRNIILWLVLTWAVIAANIILMMQLRHQVKELNNAFVRLQGKLAVIAGDQALADQSLDIIPEDTSDSKDSYDQDMVIGDYADLWGLDQVDKPQKRTIREILKRLEELSNDRGLIAQVTESYQDYPENLLEALANNPEMADFAAHYLENKGNVTGEGLTESEKSQEYPLFLQWDPRWGYASYGDDSVVGLSGCGPTALSMVLYYLTGNEELTPDKIAAYSMQEGYYMSGTGTAWLLMEEAPPVYGVSVSQPQKNEQVMHQALDRGDLIICSVGPGDFTIGGHFVVVYGYTDEGFLLNDPNCVARSRQTWPYSKIGGQIKHIWVFSKGQSVISWPVTM